MVWVSLAVLILIALLCAVLGVQNPRPAPSSQGETQPNDHNPNFLAGRFMLGDYGSPILEPEDASGVSRINVDATVKKLSEANINTYAYLICPDKNANPRVSSSQLDDLPAFSAAAGAAGIDVFVYLVPPTEAPQQAYAPFHWDYKSWATHIAEIAAHVPSIKGIMIDDFGGNTQPRADLSFHFTPAYVRDMMASARRVAPWLTFSPVLYYHDMLGPRAVLSDYRDAIQGVVFPYFGYSDGQLVPGNTKDASRAYRQGVEVARLLKCPSGPSCDQVVFPRRVHGDKTSDTATLTATFKPLPTQRRFVTIMTNDDRGTLGRGGYQVEILVDGKVVAARAPRSGWQTQAFDITSATSGKNQANVQIRLSRLPIMRDHPLTVQIDEATLSGGTIVTKFNPARMDVQGSSQTIISNVPVIYMTYATPLTAEHGQGASPAYVRSVLFSVDALRKQKLVDGSLLFNLYLPGSTTESDPENYTIVQETYGRWAAGG
ncbi:hypothetical protein GCM10009841_07990 [Microlunatus panaciterrae]|uniref:Uncharacterized protein n=1 Tax=Microlunatus panaciterrae TaxID=400768 RepID=A0ABS2RJ52_9ACTN|nr:hypothetical protein [Microlunatus panaciterrae]MBM7798547.1 hypothetical protein [Microlunatus panaciterrae]